MAFVHNSNKKINYSIVEKIKHYTDISKGKKTYKNITKTFARKRLAELKQLNQRTFEQPDLVVVNDTVFGNKGDKPRLSVAFLTKDKKIRALPLHKKKTKALVLDNYLDRQLDERGAWVEKSDLYETKYVPSVLPLTESDKKKILAFYNNVDRK